MVRIRSASEIILSLLDFYRTSQPLLDTKPGSSARDVCIDGPSTQLARLYEELRDVSSLQSLRLSIGADLDNMAINFGAVRKTGSKAVGPALLTFSSLAADIPIIQGGQITSKNGVSFVIQNGTLVSTVEISNYKAVAARYQADLEYVGITDTYAVEVMVICTTPGVSGNISKYSLNGTRIAGINHVTNVFPFGGGADSEDDSTFRSRVFSIFGGANTGTALGYKNAAKSDSSVVDAIVIEPGDDLMTRDGTQVYVAEDGTRTIISEGTGGKVDVLIYGTRLQENIDSYIYRDQSNTGDPTNPSNNHVLGQIPSDAGKTVTKKRLDDIKNGILPQQPIYNILDVRGSLSGGNFVVKNIDAWGRITGNYELLKDTGAFAGSPWGFDSLAWISDRISDFGEDLTKGTYNGQDSISYTDLLEIGSITRNIQVVNENSTVLASNRSYIQLAHFPVSVVTRVFNVTTGERYVVTDQNPDGTSSINETGRITISGQSYPAVSDILQVDYTWVFEHDPYIDYDNRLTNYNPRTVRDSVDWGFSNVVKRERVTLISSGSYLTATVTHPISAVVTANVFYDYATMVLYSSGRLVAVTPLTIDNVISITRISDGADLWNTAAYDGTFNAQAIYLPTDSVAQYGDSVTITYNGIDVYNAATQGGFSTNVISIVPSSDATAGRLVECTYISDVSTVLPQTLFTALPAIRATNSFDTETTHNIGTQPTTNIFDAFGVVSSNLRKAPTNLAITLTGSFTPGIITVTGLTTDLIFDVVFTVSSAGLKHNLSSVIKSYLGLTSIDSVPSTVQVSRIVRVERVTTSDDLVVLEVNDEYDIKGYKLRDNTFVKDECIQDTSLGTTEFTLPETPYNTDNQPDIGDRIRIRFYITTSSDYENISFSKSGTLYTNKRFVLVDIIAISSGLVSTTASISVANMNQPSTRGRYKVYYDYLAPKSNERISITYNYDKLITDVTFLVENTRPITADVLVKAASKLPVDATLNIVVTSAFKNSPEVVRQNVKDAITTKLNAQALGVTIDQSDLINAAYSVTGLDRVRVMFFNKADESASVLSVVAQENEYIVANNIEVNVELR